MIDKGGAYENNGLTKCFEIFKSKVIDVLLKATNLPLDHFIIIPGNHDIDRRSDEDYEDEGIKSSFYKKGVDYINKFTHKVLTNRNFNGVKRMQPFYEFICDLYKNCQNVHVSYLGMTVVCELKNYTIGFACLNTAWCCYDDNDYKNGVYIGEEQYNDCKNRLDGCTVKIALMHHPIDWIKIERDSIASWIYKDYDFFLCGHVHKNETNLTYNTYGSLYIDIAPSFTDEVRKIHNFKHGFTMIEYEPMSKKGTTYFYKFKFDERKFILNTDYKEDGKLDFTIYEKTTNDIEYIMTNASEYIKNTQYARFDEMLIPQKANAITSLKEAFVMPRIIKHGDIQNNTVSLSDIINNHANVLIFGAYESGKSVLLYRLVEEINDNIAQYCKVPVYIDFNEIGNRDIETEIKSYIDIQSRQVKMLLKNKSIILLVDNYNPKIETRYISKKLYTFLKENEITCIATFSNDLCGIIPQSFSTSPNEIAFEYYHMYPFEAKNVRDMIMKWMPNQDYTHWNNKVSKMVNSFCAYSLPCTPMSVSLYLWSTEKENKKPINQATLMDIYVEIILEKLSNDNVYHDSFDYENKTMLLSFLAYKIHKDIEDTNKQNNGEVLNETYSLDYNIYIDIISEYLDMLGLKNKFDAGRLGQEFVKLKIFRKSMNKVKFAHSCFYYFFLAKRMIKYPDFRDEILSDDNYYKNDRVIDYYGGLIRSDQQLLSIITNHFEKFFEPVQALYEEVDIDDFFTNIYKNGPKFKPAADSINIKAIKTNKPSIEKIEKDMLSVCDEKLSKITDDFNSNQELYAEKLIIMLAKALRNLDSVEDISLKKKAYNLFVRNSLIYTIIIKDILAKYVNSHGELPPGFFEVRNIGAFFQYMPFNLQCNINEIMGTTKLEAIYYDKLCADFKQGKSDVEKYFSLAMLLDNTKTKHCKLVNRLISSVRKNCVRDYLYYKLLVFYYYVAHNSQEEKLYLEMLVKLCKRAKRFPISTKDKIKNLLKDNKNKRGEENKL